ncbi:hypothetical protein AV530_018147 [Patagioenas fasciata monilis]|uniref:Uncharacterized protein n=1 Tax=Patagioenas fasciata monilis TaxID=372326 RepID=A0A1V4KL00_PATFA|nr:hypothetical protein AV530_018147 [Patagioenas fasciata monilis]
MDAGAFAKAAGFTGGQGKAERPHLTNCSQCMRMERPPVGNQQIPNSQRQSPAVKKTLRCWSLGKRNLQLLDCTAASVVFPGWKDAGKKQRKSTGRSLMLRVERHRL